MRIDLFPAALAAVFVTTSPLAAQDFAAPAAPRLSAAETTWHVRAALNVAALACRDGDAAATVAGYNALLVSEAAPFAAAAAGMEAQYRIRYGTAWQARSDDDMTRLYNFFAAPAAHDDFCAVAKTVLHDAGAVEPAAFPAFAAAVLPVLEAPFAPRDTFAPPMTLATVARVPVTPDDR